MEKVNVREKILSVISKIIFTTSIVELALSQLSIRIMRLSSEEFTGIAYFAFIIFGLVSLFVTSRIKESAFGMFFAIIINFITAIAGLWALQFLISDEIFFRNLYYTLNRQTQVFEILPTSGLITASIPLGLIILGSAIYCLCATVILIVSISFLGKRSN